ncbi:serine/threonine protein kinase [Fonticula alba]|uniref:Serine/threonine protein kinase n=1 Tax=Fonticula alba TaxID=691883 RepID=A0A058ZFQ4_FONAL|nr:serine/threonine protein kinase [Fonticula alba]KCV72758.1 serine/threonine protein kinase [Fonticula alba]|eukprot:XP_009492459.1 serine/threonine protein kinase [Fonticula alba]
MPAGPVEDSPPAPGPPSGEAVIPVADFWPWALSYIGEYVPALQTNVQEVASPVSLADAWVPCCGACGSSSELAMAEPPRRRVRSSSPAVFRVTNTRWCATQSGFWYDKCPGQPAGSRPSGLLGEGPFYHRDFRAHRGFVPGDVPGMPAGPGSRQWGCPQEWGWSWSPPGPDAPFPGPGAEIFLIGTFALRLDIIYPGQRVPGRMAPPKDRSAGYTDLLVNEWQILERVQGQPGFLTTVVSIDRENPLAEGTQTTMTMRLTEDWICTLEDVLARLDARTAHLSQVQARFHRPADPSAWPPLFPHLVFLGARDALRPAVCPFTQLPPGLQVLPATLTQHFPDTLLALELLAQVVSALVLLHNISVVHAAIRPRSILLTVGDPHLFPSSHPCQGPPCRPTLRACLDSFEWAAISRNLLVPGVPRAGGSRYLAPELLVADDLPSSPEAPPPGGRLTPKADVYALGVILRQFLPLFEAERARFAEIPDPDADQVPDFVALAQDLVARMTEARPALRLTMTEILLHDLFACTHTARGGIERPGHP